MPIIKTKQPKAFPRVLLSSAKDNWGTPQWLFDKLDEEFGFAIDVAADGENTKCALYYDAEQNGLEQPWKRRGVDGAAWCNPPYGRKVGASAHRSPPRRPVLVHRPRPRPRVRRARRGPARHPRSADVSGRNLYLDDVRAPPAHGGWTLCRTLAEAQAFVLAGPVDYMSLDHDLDLCPKCHAGQSVGDAQADVIAPPCSCPPTSGLDFVRWLVETDRWPRFKPLVHSANPDGAHAMRQMIDRHWRAS